MRDPSSVFNDAVDELFQGCGRKIPRQILLPIFNRNTQCNKELVPEGDRLAFFIKDVSYRVYQVN